MCLKTEVLILILWICVLIQSSNSLRRKNSSKDELRPPTQSELASFVNEAGKTNYGQCGCNNVTLLCKCKVQVNSMLGAWQSVDVSSTLAAIAVQEMKQEQSLILGTIDKSAIWPPREPIAASSRFPELGTFSGHEEPMKHLELLPQNLELIGTKFFLFTNENSNPILIGYQNQDQLNRFPKTCSKVFMISHGFRGSSNDGNLIQLRKELLKRDQSSCVVMVDWTRGAAFDSYALSSYSQAAVNAMLVGREVGLLISKLADQNVLELSNLHLIGFSLGAHVFQFASRWYNDLQRSKSSNLPTGLTNRRRNPRIDQVKQIGRITGLDPAARHFQGYEDCYLDSKDANFVDIIHTSSVINDGSIYDMLNSRFGFSKSIGDVDFYPNGGIYQPDCSNISFMSNSAAEYYGCSHQLSISYFLDSLKSGYQDKLISVPCDDYNHLSQCKVLFLGQKSSKSLSSQGNLASRIPKRLSSTAESAKSKARSVMGIDSDHYSGRGKQFLSYSRINV